MSTDDRTDERASGQAPADRQPIDQYEIRVSGHLGTRWAAWFEGMTLVDEDDGTTVIRGPVIDQAALHGVIQTLRDLGMTLLSLTPLAPGTPPEQPTPIRNQTRPDPRGAIS